MMKTSYSMFRSIRGRVPAPSVSFGEGAWMVIAGQSSWGKGAIAGEEARRGRKATSERKNEEFRISNEEFEVWQFFIRNSSFEILHSKFGNHDGHN